LATAGIGVVALCGLVLWVGKSSPSLAEARTLAARNNTAAALQVAAVLLAQRPADPDLLALLNALYSGLCDPATEEPNPHHAGPAAQRIAVALRTALSNTQGTPEQYQILGEFALLAGQYDAAIAAFRQVETHGIAPDRAAVPLALALLRAGQPRDIASEIDPKTTQSPRQQALRWTFQARAQLALAHTAQARVEFEAALAADPGNANALSRFGMLELWHGNPAAAADLLVRARSAAPQAAPTLRLAAELAYATADYQASAQAYDALVRSGAEDDFDPIPPSLGKARALIYQGDLSAAAAALDASALGSHDPTLTYYRALLAYRAGDFRRAGELAQGLDVVLPGYPPVDMLIGGAMLATGLPETATKHLRHYVDAVPDNTAAQSLLRSAEDQLAHPDHKTPVAPADLLAPFGFPTAEPSASHQAGGL
jgi:tetratricopeptide (TPR) repeat protein